MFDYLLIDADCNTLIVITLLIDDIYTFNVVDMIYLVAVMCFSKCCVSFYVLHFNLHMLRHHLLLKLCFIQYNRLLSFKTLSGQFDDLSACVSLDLIDTILPFNHPSLVTLSTEPQKESLYNNC